MWRNGTHTIDAMLWFGGPAEWVTGDFEDGFEEYDKYGQRGVDGGKDPALEPAVVRVLIRKKPYRSVLIRSNLTERLHCFQEWCEGGLPGGLQENSNEYQDGSGDCGQHRTACY
jgi:hypothetical protein